MKSGRNITVAVILLVVLLIGFCVFNGDKPGPSGGGPKDFPQVSFLIPQEGFEVARDYNQRLFIPIRNNGPGVARLRLSSTHFPDLPVGFVGRGTPDWEEPDTVLEIPEGEIWEAPLLVHGSVAERNDYTLTLTAVHEGATAGKESCVVRLQQPELQLETTLRISNAPVDKARLVRTLRIRNLGANIPDLGIHFESEGAVPTHPIHLDPVLEGTTLASGEVIEVRIRPYLYPSFEKLAGDLVLTGHNQQQRVPYLAEVPAGKAVFVTLSRTSSRSSNSGTRCTNMPGSSYDMPATHGTPASTEWGGGGGGGGLGGGGGMGGGGLTVTDSNPRLEPEEIEDGGEPGEQDADDGSWTLFGPLDDDADGGEESSDDGEGESSTVESEEWSDEIDEGGEADEEANPDEGTFDLLDANTEGVVGGFLPPTAFGTSLREMTILSPDLRAPDLEPFEDEGAPGVPEGTITTFGPGKKDDKESSTYADQDGRRTHLTRRTRDDGAQFLNFGWGIAGKGRRLNGYFGPAPVSRPVLGPNPRPGAPALATFVEGDPEDEERNVVKVVDPETGESVVLSDPGKRADSPVSMRTDKGVETVFREDGKLKRISLSEDLKATESDDWPTGIESGPVVDAEPLGDGRLALLAKADDGNMVLRTRDGERRIPATDGSMATAGDRLFVAGRNQDGSLFAFDPDDEGTGRFATGDAGYGPPTLIGTGDGGMRMFYHKPLPATAPEGGFGSELGGNFAVDFKDGEWGEPRRVYLPDAPVTDAAVAVEFTPPFDRAHYKEMNTGISLNGRKLRTLEEQIPFGRYLFQVPTSALGYRADASTDSGAANRVVIDSEGIGPGNFLISDKASIYGLHDWTQGCYVATSNDEADRIAQLSSPELRHNAHDLVLATNGAQLPRDLQPGETREFTFAAFNAGDQPSPNTRVSILYETVEVGGGALVSLPPFRGRPVKVSFTVPQAWQPGTSLRLVASVPDEGDADPATNRLNLDLLREFQPAIAGPTRPTAVSPEALPVDRVTSVEPATGDQPAVFSLNGREWFRCTIPSEGDLQVSVTGPEAALVDRIDLFDAEGRALRPESGSWQTGGDELFIRVGLPPGESLSPATEIRIWWE
ncbi:hypothetical protein [Haloferula sp. A504]|uniref:hypothetical protein n=1 Tax=Haloferula sp. A504 TaxID=3373601 RepID=UPI0031BD4F84|nr:hypothetical protein [Verrucomicrobiaceae bacterium E54]